MKKERPEDVRMQQAIELRASLSLAVLGAAFYHRFGKFLSIRRPGEPYREQYTGPNGKVLKRFRKWTVVRTDEDRKVLRRYASTGMVVFRYNSRAHRTEAKLTDQGKWFAKYADWSR